jgi:hypothetical protein
MHEKIHPQAGIGRSYLNGKEGGRGLLQIEATNTTEVINTAEILNTKLSRRPFCEYC